VTRDGRLVYFLFVVMLFSFGLEDLLCAQQKPLRAYGPQGAFSPMKECADMFFQRSGINVEVISDPGEEWITQARQDADIIYEETESMLMQFMAKYPCLVDESTRTSLYQRPAGILVRKGNPKGIRTIADLTVNGVYLLDVNGSGQLGLWEDLAGLKGLIPGMRQNIAVSVSTSAEAVEMWKNRPELDAWITFESWHHLLKDSSDFVRLPKDEKICRGTALVATHFYKNKEAARKFIQFLTTPESHAVFQKWGWE